MYCVHCGKEVDEEDIFCRKCGKRLEDTPTGNGKTAEGIRIISKEDPLFRVKCEYCRCEFEYRLGNLGYRLWYPSGFVYCPNCEKPLRHKLEYEVKNEE